MNFNSEQESGLNIRNIRFVIEDKFPLLGVENQSAEFSSSIDFDSDGIIGWNDQRPMMADFDTDNDGVFDSEDWDIDGDGLGNHYEDEIGTDPYNADTDGDGSNDGYDPYPNDSSLGGSEIINVFNEYIIADGTNNSWPLWDCCGGSSQLQ